VVKEELQSATVALFPEDLYNLPENITGEIIDGEVIATARPSRR